MALLRADDRCFAFDAAVTFARAISDDAFDDARHAALYVC